MRRVATIALALAALAGMAVDADAARTRNLSTGTSLVDDVSLGGNDSDLVRAAKLSVAYRQRVASLSKGILIDDDYLREHQAGRITTTSGGAPVAPYVPQSTNAAPAATAPGGPTVDRAAIERDNRRLRDEQARAGAEMEEPYGGNNTGMEEDRAEQRSTQIPKEIQKNNQQLNSKP